MYINENDSFMHLSMANHIIILRVRFMFSLYMAPFPFFFFFFFYSLLLQLLFGPCTAPNTLLSRGVCLLCHLIK